MTTAAVGLSSTAKLYPIGPNPFQETALIEFSLPSAATVQVRVLNMLGQKIAILHQSPAGQAPNTLGAQQPIVWPVLCAVARRGYFPGSQG